MLETLRDPQRADNAPQGLQAEGAVTSSRSLMTRSRRGPRRKSVAYTSLHLTELRMRNSPCCWSAVLLATTARARSPRSRLTLRPERSRPRCTDLRARRRAGAAVVLSTATETGDMWGPLAARWHAATPSSCRSARHGPSPPTRPVATTRRPRRPTSPRPSTRSRSTSRSRHPRHRKHGGLRLRSGQPDASRKFASWMHRCRVSAHGRDPEDPLLWHFRFGGPDMERLVKGASGSI